MTTREKQNKASRESLMRKVKELEGELAKLREQAVSAAIQPVRSSERGAAAAKTKHSLEQANDELRDLTEKLDKNLRRRTQALVESEEQLRLSKEELKRLNQNKAEFVSIAAHELRTPLTSIVGYLELMAEGRFGEIGPKMQRPMLSVRRNAMRLRRLVDEMLDVSRIEAERMSIKKSLCSVGDIGSEVVQELLPHAETKQQVINCDIKACPDIQADADKIHQVISNLVSNSLRYCPAGGIVDIVIDRAPVGRYPGNWARIRVRDNGPGISESDLDAIFEPFSDISPAKHHTSRGPAAAGLGLYIAKGLVDLHEGIITVESELGSYTEFAVLLPVDQ